MIIHNLLFYDNILYEFLGGECNKAPWSPNMHCNLNSYCSGMKSNVELEQDSIKNQCIGGTSRYLGRGATCPLTYFWLADEIRVAPW